MRFVPQDFNEMMFCQDCQMNAFPSRPKFNAKSFGICALVLLPIIIANILLFQAFAWLFTFLFFMWGFMILNPHAIVYGLKKKQYCPRCHQKLIEKNQNYRPFGEIDPEVFRSLAPSNKPETHVSNKVRVKW